MSLGKHIGNEELRACALDLKDSLTDDWGNEETLEQIKSIEDAMEFASYRDDPEYIREDYFNSGEYAEFLAGQLGPIRGWPYDCIDWEKAADALRVDYRQVEILGDTYYVRS